MNEGGGAIRTIVVGLDGSVGSAAALRWAIGLALALDAEIVAAHVFQLPGSTGHGGAVAEIPYEESWRAVVREAFRVEWAAPLETSGVPHRLVFAEGRAGPELLSVAEREQAGLIVTGHRGVDAASELIVGSVTQHLAHHTRRCPLAVVPRGDDARPSGPPSRTP
jgi:nucleotide-binding universal stress UspA family protein